MIDYVLMILEILIDNFKEGIYIVYGERKTIYYNKVMTSIEYVSKKLAMGKNL